MPTDSEASIQKPTLKDLGYDLLDLSGFQLILTLAAPPFFFLLYWLFAALGYWPAAILCTMALSFSTYGSTSHDLVHENLKIPKLVNTILLSFTEAICFRSGHAYKVSHLYHHKRFPHEDDVEGAASRMTLLRTLAEGFIFQFKIYAWSITVSKDTRYRPLILLEGVVILLLVAGCLFAMPFSYAPCVYLCLMVAGSWIIPLVTSYAVHTPHGAHELKQTRLFRGWFFSSIAFDHLYHLEHHLYPMVPHKNWPKLAARLDGFFQRQGIEAIEFKIMPSHSAHG
jgi:beta-carotene hydroxylase